MAMDRNQTTPVTEGTTALPNRTIKDSVFRDLFGTPKYLLELYQVLHPEDQSATEEDLGDVTIKNVLIGNLYNDLGFIARGKLLIMVEAQSTWTKNIVVRLLMYLADIWNSYIKETSQNPYGSRKLQLPEPEFYVIFTGDRGDRPEWINLSDEFLPSGKGNLELKAKILYGDDSGDILDQYITFTKVLDQKIREMGPTQEAVAEAIRVCKDREILKNYLESREKEVVRIMMTLFDQDYLTMVYGKEQREEGREEGSKDTQKANVLRLHGQGFSSDSIATMLDLSIETVKEWLSDDAVLV